MEDVAVDASVDKNALKAAFAEASRFRGSTAPNPPVGAAALDSSGRILSCLAHERAGTPHAEARVIEDCRQRGLLSQVKTLVVTLEPCNHQGRTPPCTQGILEAGIPRVVFGCADPNPKVKGGGAAALRAQGVSVEQLELDACRELLAPFAKWSTTGIPFITLKAAYLKGSMIPPAGMKTFTQASSLDLAHQLRKESDAILTGSGTVLADNPEFTVRRVPDHPGKVRWLSVLDRRSRVPRVWVEGREKAGFQVRVETDLAEALKFLGKQGVLEVLIEAGPTLTDRIISSGLWDRFVLIEAQEGKPDSVTIRRNQTPCLPESSKI